MISPDSTPLLDNFEEVIAITTRKILAGTLTDSDRVLLQQLALALIAETILVDEDLMSRIHPEVLAALHQLAFLSDPSTDAAALNAFAFGVVEDGDE